MCLVGGIHFNGASGNRVRASSACASSRRRLSDRDVALQNVRYVLSAAGGLHEDFVPAPGGFIQQRAHLVLDEAVELLEAGR